MDHPSPPDSGDVDTSSEPKPAHAGFRRFVGVSLGGGRGKNTAVARLEPEPEGEGLFVAEARTRRFERGGGSLDGEHPGAPFRDRELLAWLREWVDEDTLVAFDAPLTLPVCVRCQLHCPGVENCEVPVVQWMRAHAPRLHSRKGRSDPDKPYVTPYTQRATELVMERLTLQPREALGQGMGPLAARAAYLRRAMAGRLELHTNLIEVHPRATLIRCFGAQLERATRIGDIEDTRDARKEALAGLSEGLRFVRVWPELVVRKVQVFHAVVAAFSGLAHARRSGPVGPRALLGGTDAALDAALSELGEMWRQDGWIF